MIIVPDVKSALYLEFVQILMIIVMVAVCVKMLNVLIIIPNVQKAKSAYSVRVYVTQVQLQKRLLTLYQK
ncbi:MAG: hypothetical protein A2Z25_06250 [Planctomycetes bacterium RBG_16_55_9]|nr:MAG: hypothetical protein A2Z25_06250 [Planctomycetes bacterium RBG_16_55_9]